VGAYILDLSCQGNGSHRFHQSVMPMITGDCCSTSKQGSYQRKLPKSIHGTISTTQWVFEG